MQGPTLHDWQDLILLSTGKLKHIISVGLILAEKLIILLIGNLRLPFLNANSGAGMRNITVIQVLSGV